MLREELIKFARDLRSVEPSGKQWQSWNLQARVTVIGNVGTLNRIGKLL